MSVEFLKRVIEKTGFNRERFSERHVPENLQGLTIVPFFGDPSSEVILSTTLLNRISRKYLIILSWPGHSGLYPYANEYWSVTDEASLLDISKTATGFVNSRANAFERILLRYMDGVMFPDEIVNNFYDGYFTKQFFEEFEKVVYRFPALPSVTMSMDRGFDDQRHVFMWPSKYIQRWRVNKQELMPIQEAYWKKVVSGVLSKGMKPVLLTNYSSYDLSAEFSKDCFYITENNILAILGVMRSCHCVFDLFNGLSRYAIVARTPYFVCDERRRYYQAKDYVLDDLLAYNLPKKFMFSFAPLVEGDTWDLAVNGFCNGLLNFVENIDRDILPSTIEVNKEVDLDLLRSQSLKRIGLRFFSVPTMDD